MAGTPNVRRVQRLVRAHWGSGPRFSVYNCRLRRSGRGWSQHAGSQRGPDGRWLYRGNAVDIFPTSRAQGDQMAEWLYQHRAALGLQQILWQRRNLVTGNPVSGHTDHIHAGMWPMMRDDLDYVPPCKGGTLIVHYPRGHDPRHAHEFVLWPDSGDPPPPDSPEREDLTVEFQTFVAGFQTGLIKAGIDLGKWPPLTPDHPPGADGIPGDDTWKGWQEFCARAVAGGSEPDADLVARVRALEAFDEQIRALG